MSGGWHLTVSPGAVAAAAVLLAGGAWLAVRLVRRHERDRRVVAMEALRVLVLAMVALTLLRPERVRPLEEKRRPTVAVLYDASASMTTADVVGTNAGPARGRADWVREQIERRFWAPLEARYEVAVEAFGAEATATNAPDAEPRGTDLAGALRDADRRSDALRAVLLLGDGDWTAGDPPVQAALALRKRGVPVYAVAVGSPRHLPDLEVRQVAAPAYSLTDESVRIPFTIESRMPRDVEAVVSVRGRSGEEATRAVRIPAYGVAQDSVLLRPQREGVRAYTLEVPPEPDERTPANNRREFSIEFRKETIEVLVVESVPRWEFRFLRNAMARDPGVRADCVLLHPGLAPATGRGYLRRFPATREDLARYDVVFLGDLGAGPGELSRGDLEQLRGLVEQQASGLVFLPGPRGGQRSLAGTPIEDLSPVEMDPAHAKGYGTAVESRPALTSLGAGHLLCLLAADPDANRALWEKLPGFHWCAASLRPRPGSDVLAVHESLRNEHGRVPLLAVRPAGNGKVLYMGTDAAWRWRRGVEDTYHYRFWAQVVRWMAYQRHLAGREGIRFFCTPEQPRAGDRVGLSALVRGASGFPLEHGLVTARVKEPSGRVVETVLASRPGGWGLFEGGFVPRAGGAHEVEIESPTAGRRLTATLEVAPVVPEKLGRPARPDVLREIARVTGGEAGGGADLDRFVQALAGLPRPAALEERFRLWCHPGWAVAVALLLGLYWVLRKLAGLI